MMKTTTLRIISIILIAVMMTAVISACRNGDEADDDSGSADISNVTGEDAVSLQSEYVYVAHPVPLPDDIGYIISFAYQNDKIYFTSISSTPGSEETPYLGTSTFNLYSVNTDGTELAALPGYTHPYTIPADSGGETHISSFTFDSTGNLWVFEGFLAYIYDLPENFDEENDYYWNYSKLEDFGAAIRKLDDTGAELLSIDLSGIPLLNQPDGRSVDAFAVALNPDTGEEIIYISCSEFLQGKSTIYALNSAGDILFQREGNVPPGQFSFVQMPNGEVAYPVIPESNYSNIQQLQIIDSTKPALGSTVSLPDIAERVYNGGSGYDALLSDYGNIYGYDFTEKTTTKLLSWLDCNISRDGVDDILITDDGDFICKKFNMSAQSPSVEIYVLSKILRSELPEKTVITLATAEDLTYKTIRDDIVKFNNSNLFYRIEILDYSQYNTDDDYSAGAMRLGTDIITGNIPDIFLLSYEMPFADYVSAGLFTDIYPFIDADPELTRDDLLEPVFKAAEIDGKLYQVFPDFNVSTIFGDVSVLGPGMGWNMDEFEAVLSAHPEADMPFGAWMNKFAFLQWYISAYPDKFIDRETGSAHFDTPEFIRILELSDRISTYTGNNPYAEMPYEEPIFAGRQIMWYMPIHDFREIHVIREQYGWDIVFKGLPVDDKNGHRFSLSYANNLAIAESSPNKDAAWSFVRTFLTKEWQLGEDGGFRFLAFPTNTAAFEQKIEDTLKLGYATGYQIINGEILPDRVTTPEELERLQSEIDTIVSLINSTTAVAGRERIDEALMNIIMEEAADYFNGIRSAEDAARGIQSRAALYVSERS